MLPQLELPENLQTKERAQEEEMRNTKTTREGGIQTPEAVNPGHQCPESGGAAARTTCREELGRVFGIKRKDGKGSSAGKCAAGKGGWITYHMQPNHFSVLET